MTVSLPVKIWEMLVEMTEETGMTKTMILCNVLEQFYREQFKPRYKQKK